MAGRFSELAVDSTLTVMGSARFCVEASNKQDPRVCESERYFSTWGEALAAVGAGGYRYKWISEYGRYIDRHGVEREDWIYVFWSPNETYGNPPEMGFGYPYKDFDGPRVRYEPAEPPR